MAVFSQLVNILTFELFKALMSKKSTYHTELIVYIVEVTISLCCGYG